MEDVPPPTDVCSLSLLWSLSCRGCGPYPGTPGREPVCQGEEEGLLARQHWGCQRQSTPVFLPGESQGQRSLVGYSLQGHEEADTAPSSAPRASPPAGPQERLGQPAERLCQSLTCRGPTPAFQARDCTGGPGERGGRVDRCSLTHALAHTQAQEALGRGVDAWTGACSHTRSLTRRPRAHVSKGEGRLSVRGERRAWVLP